MKIAATTTTKSEASPAVAATTNEFNVDWSSAFDETNSSQIDPFAAGVDPFGATSSAVPADFDPFGMPANNLSTSASGFGEDNWASPTFAAQAISSTNAASTIADDSHPDNASDTNTASAFNNDTNSNWAAFDDGKFEIDSHIISKLFGIHRSTRHAPSDSV